MSESVDLAKGVSGDSQPAEAPAIQNPNNADFIVEEGEAVNEDEVDEDEDDGGVHVTVKKEGMKDYYLQKYKQEWENLPEFRDWLQPVADDQYKAECVMCHTFLRCHKLKLRQHAKSRKHHLSMVAGGRTTSRRLSAVSNQRSERRSFGRRVGGAPRSRGRANWAPRTRFSEQADTPGPQDVSYNDSGRVTYSIGLGGNKVGFIGAGTIAQAVARALLDKGVVHSGRLMVSAPSVRHLSMWTAWGSTVTNSNDEVLRTCDVVFLCVPLAAAVPVLQALGPFDTYGERCFVSLVPGLSRERIEKILLSKYTGEYSADGSQITELLFVIRCMVNLAVRTGNGCCGYSLPPGLPDRWLLCLEVMCGSLGVSELIDDDKLDAFAAAFSSGTSFALAFSEALAMGAASAGVPWPLARKMAAQTLLGTGQLLLDADRPGSLRDQAAPAGGALIAGLVALKPTSLESGVTSAVQACLKVIGEGC